METCQDDHYDVILWVFLRVPKGLKRCENIFFCVTMQHWQLTIVNSTEMQAKVFLLRSALDAPMWREGQRGHVHTAAKFGCQFTFYSVIAFCTHIIHKNTGVTSAFDNRINSRKIQVVTTAFTEILRSVYRTELNN